MKNQDDEKHNIQSSKKGNKQKKDKRIKIIDYIKHKNIQER